MQLCVLSDPVGQYRISDRGVSDEREGKGKGHSLQGCIHMHTAEVDYQGQSKSAQFIMRLAV